MNDSLRIPFMMATMLVAIPTGVKFFSWVATMWGGKLSFETPMLFVLGAISVFPDWRCDRPHFGHNSHRYAFA